MACGCKQRNQNQPVRTVSVNVSEVNTPAPTSIPAAPQQ
jgi:hypothetical protein